MWIPSRVSTGPNGSMRRLGACQSALGCDGASVEAMFRGSTELSITRWYCRYFGIGPREGPGARLVRLRDNCFALRPLLFDATLRAPPIGSCPIHSYLCGRRGVFTVATIRSRHQRRPRHRSGDQTRRGQESRDRWRSHRPDFGAAPQGHKGDRCNGTGRQPRIHRLASARPESGGVSVEGVGRCDVCARDGERRA